MDTTIHEGNYSPPRNYSFEPELSVPVPRPIPDFVKEGSYARSATRSCINAIFIGALLIGLASAGFVSQLGYYFIPLAYLSWIGWIMLSLGLLGLLSHKFHIGKYSFIRRGNILSVEVTDIAMAPTMKLNGQDARYSFVVSVRGQHPVTQEVFESMLFSPDFPAETRKLYSTTLRKGQFVTAIYLPGKFENSLTLYGFTGLNPIINFVLLDKSADAQSNIFLQISVVAAMFFCLLWDLYCMQFYQPVVETHWPMLIPISVASFCAGILAMVMYVREARKSNNRSDLSSTSVNSVLEYHSAQSKLSIMSYGFIILLGTGFLCAITLFANAWAVNAIFDQSADRDVKVAVIGIEQKIHKLLFREAKLYFISPWDGKKTSVAIPHTHQGQLMSADILLKVKNGYLGWPWIADFQAVNNRTSDKNQ